MNKQDIPDRALIQLRNHLINEAEEWENDCPCRFEFDYTYENEDGTWWYFEGEVSAELSIQFNEYSSWGKETVFERFSDVWCDCFYCGSKEDEGDGIKVEFDDVRFANPNPSVMLQIAEEQVQSMKKLLGYDPIEELDSLIASTKIAS